ncbi:MAG TPA: serine/threonine-protein kinase, partial [Anaerolineae bacterium]|nr:serine/threonine-protein kinase [Anaerolineae bacterium]
MMSFAIGEQVGPYQIMAQLGSGGMATVFKAYHAALDRYVAIKVLHPAFKQDPNFLTRFQREARIVAKLDHPHIVPVYDFSEANGQPYLVMRFIAGETLKARLSAGALMLAEVRRVIKPVADALAYAHGQGVLHRDVKPSNILLTPEGDVFLADFGLARIAQAGESTLSQDSLLGTPQYISPEQAQGQSDLDARTDVYSLGVVIYELLVGRVPYQADTPYAVIHDHIYAPLPLPRSIKPDFPEAIERVLLKALTKDRADRYASVSELWSAFERAVNDLSSSAPASPDPAPRVPAPIAAPPPIDSLATKILPSAEGSNSRTTWLLAGVMGLMLIVIAAIVVLNMLRPTYAGLPHQSTSVPL